MPEKIMSLKTTIAAEHTKRMKVFEQQMRTLPKKKDQLKKLTVKLSEASTYPLITDLEDEINELKADIQSIESQNVKHKYWIKAAPHITVLCQNNTLINRGRTKKTVKMKKIDKYDGKANLERYMTQVSSGYVKKNVKHKKSEDIFCADCDEYRVPEDDMMVCTVCGDIVKVIKESEYVSYKDPPTNSTNYNYQPLNHFKDWLMYLQAKENTDITEIVETMKKVQKRRHLKPEALNDSVLRRLLAKAGYNKYYEHIPLILFKLTGKKPPSMSDENENRLCQMFLTIRESWDKHKSARRKNMLSYPYIICKFCELLELYEWIPRLKMLGCKEYLHNNDKVWRKICHDMGGEKTGWKYISSF